MCLEVAGREHTIVQRAGRDAGHILRCVGSTERRTLRDGLRGGVLVAAQHDPEDGLVVVVRLVGAGFVGQIVGTDGTFVRPYRVESW